MKKGIVIEVICGLFVLLFVYTAVNKLIEHQLFENTLMRSPLLRSFAVPLSWLLPFTELAVAVLLFFGRTRKIGLYLSLGLMLCFTAYIAYMVMFEPNLPCSCGGVIKLLSWKQHLLFNSVFIVLAFVGVSILEQVIGEKQLKEFYMKYENKDKN